MRFYRLTEMDYMWNMTCNKSMLIVEKERNEKTLVLLDLLMSMTLLIQRGNSELDLI